MNRDLTGYRKSYEKGVLHEDDISDSPFQLFSEWFEEVEKYGGVEETNAMTITTKGIDGFPKARIVLLKHFDENGFIFYSNYNSEKGKAISADNKICLSFFWPNLERQVIIKGTAIKIEEEKSLLYFRSRPRGSQLGAFASSQSEIIDSRDTLEEKLSFLEEKYKNQDIPKPDSWGGYNVIPVEFEFWQGRANRLHDRIRYTQKDTTWKIDRLAP
ncbi:pyridoxamine 5'-phosphate oxidase [Aquimarina algicola]|uniref:Pyridoxine/pyridoxamine 5'-phosphate oxidase n=1 Tax=Aquimarina algicola TaxID=2589995 RepID=A0A504JJE7_9FLAO|nr:pyridoxamine 5'-phosphate oxidase [Aquimarina algicola]TPN88892.1 pyridoxamine 5'-phosphate oxidase [Aquimarina algicola]